MKFNPEDLKKLYKRPNDSKGEDNGQTVIIGGSTLFHGAPLMSLRVASRVVDMVFFASPEKTLEEVVSYMKADLGAFIWVPWGEIDEYIKKSDSVLIGPGFMRYRNGEGKDHKEDDCDEACMLTKTVTNSLLEKFPDKKWVIDAGSLHLLDKNKIPKNSILTPNDSEYEALFGDMDPLKASEEFNCVIVRKGVVGHVYASGVEVEIEGGNAGLTKGGTGDVQAGLTASFLAKNDPLLSACAASFIVKKTAEKLEETIGTYFNSDDLADSIPAVLASYTK